MKRRLWRSPVLVSPDGDPQEIYFRGDYRLVVLVHDRWEWAGEWWAMVYPRKYWLVELREGEILEVFQHLPPAYLPTMEPSARNAAVRRVGWWGIARVFD